MEAKAEQEPTHAHSTQNGNKNLGAGEKPETLVNLAGISDRDSREGGEGSRSHRLKPGNIAKTKFPAHRGIATDDFGVMSIVRNGILHAMRCGSPQSAGHPEGFAPDGSGFVVANSLQLRST